MTAPPVSHHQIITKHTTDAKQLFPLYEEKIIPVNDEKDIDYAKEDSASIDDDDDEEEEEEEVVVVQKPAAASASHHSASQAAADEVEVGHCWLLY